MTAGDPANWKIAGAHRPPLQFNSLARLAVSARSRAAHEYLFSIEVFHEHADALTLSALGLIREHLDLASNRQTGLRDAIPEEIHRRSAIHAPVGHFSFRASNIDPQND